MSVLTAGKLLLLTRRVGDEFTKKNLLVRVEGVDDEVEKLGDLGCGGVSDQNSRLVVVVATHPGSRKSQWRQS